MQNQSEDVNKRLCVSCRGLFVRPEEQWGFESHVTYSLSDIEGGAKIGCFICSRINNRLADTPADGSIDKTNPLVATVRIRQGFRDLLRGSELQNEIEMILSLEARSLRIHDRVQLFGYTVQEGSSVLKTACFHQYDRYEVPLKEEILTPHASDKERTEKSTPLDSDLSQRAQKLRSTVT
jgi:hypothetical protein